MKFFATLLTFVFVCHAVAQNNVFTVNNTPGIQANYTTLQGALDSVPAGSVLLLQPSAISYGSVNISKPVVIYGPGYFLGQNPNPYNQARNAESIVGHLSFVKGSNGSKVYGLSLTAPPNGFSGRIYMDSTSNITISRSRFTSTGDCGQGCTPVMFNIHAASSIAVEQTMVDMSNGGVFLAPRQASDLSFQNNIVMAQPWIGFTIINYGDAPFSYTFGNNSFFAANFQTVDLANGSFSNNVFIASGQNGQTYVNNAPAYADHNVSNVSLFSSTNNISNADGTNTFVGTSDLGISSQDGVWKLKPGSVAIGYGNDGKDAGAYGGDKPYVLSGIPAIPNIYFAEVIQPATSADGLKVHLRIKANQ